MTNWPYTPIEDLCALVIDCINKTAPVVESPTPFKMIRTTNVRHGRVDTVNVRYVNEETYRKWTRRGVPLAGDVILTREAPLGDVGLLRGSETVFLGQRLVMYRADPKKSVNRYLLYALLSPGVQGAIRALGSGATVEHLRVRDCETIPLPAPPLSVQRKIATALAAYDELIENNLRRMAILEEISQAVYREWFVDFRFPGHEKIALVDSALGPIPEGWEVTTLGEVADYISRGVSPKYDDESGAIVINQKCVRNHRVSFEPARPHSTKVKHEKQLRVGDVLINSTGVGTLGRVAQLRRPVRNVTVDSHVTIVRPPSIIESEYWGRALIAQESRFEGLGAGATGQTELRKSAVEATEFLLPLPAVTTRYSDLIRPFDELAENLITQNANLRATRDLLLPKLVSGEIDVSNLDIDTEWLAS